WRTARSPRPSWCPTGTATGMATATEPSRAPRARQSALARLATKNTNRAAAFSSGNRIYVRSLAPFRGPNYAQSSGQVRCRLLSGVPGGTTRPFGRMNLCRVALDGEGRQATGGQDEGAGGYHQAEDQGRGQRQAGLEVRVGVDRVREAERV